MKHSTVCLTLGPALLMVILICSPITAQTADRAASENRSHSARSLPAIVESVDDVVISPPFDGVFMESFVVEGQRVQAGEVIGRMDDRVPLAALRVAEQASVNDARVRSAETRLAAAKRLEKRIQIAHQRAAASELELDRAQQEVEQADVALDDARAEQKRLAAQLELARAECEQYRIVAPFSGTILKQFVSPGQAVVRGEELFHIANLEQFKANLQIDTDYYGQLTCGQVYQLSAGMPVNRTIPARLTFIEPRVDAATKTFRCRFDFRNENRSLPVGFTVSFHPQDVFTPSASQAGSQVLPEVVQPLILPGRMVPWSELTQRRPETSQTLAAGWGVDERRETPATVPADR